MKVILITILLLKLSACGSTAYKKMGYTGGYKDTALPDGTIQLKFRDNGFTSMEQVKIFWERRANELCPSGYNILSAEDKSFGSYTQYIKANHPVIEGIIKCK